jgi:hypothetical protein
MRLLQKLLLGPLVFTFLLPLNARAQVRHAVDPSDLAEVVAAHGARDDQNRTMVRDTLARPEVRDVATRLGLDSRDLDRSIGLLAGDDLARAADAARQIDDALVGGQSSIVISTTTIIVILLLVIIIVAVAD